MIKIENKTSKSDIDIIGFMINKLSRGILTVDFNNHVSKIDSINYNGSYITAHINDEVDFNLIVVKESSNTKILIQGV